MSKLTNCDPGGADGFARRTITISLIAFSSLLLVAPAPPWPAATPRSRPAPRCWR